MIYPDDMTPEEIMEFEYEYNRFVDMERQGGQWWALNAELQVVGTEEAA